MKHSLSGSNLGLTDLVKKSACSPQVSVHKYFAYLYKHTYKGPEAAKRDYVVPFLECKKDPVSGGGHWILV